METLKSEEKVRTSVKMSEVIAYAINHTLHDSLDDYKESLKFYGIHYACHHAAVALLKCRLDNVSKDGIINFLSGFGPESIVYSDLYSQEERHMFLHFVLLYLADSPEEDLEIAKEGVEGK